MENYLLKPGNQTEKEKAKELIDLAFKAAKSDINENFSKGVIYYLSDLTSEMRHLDNEFTEKTDSIAKRFDERIEWLERDSSSYLRDSIQHIYERLEKLESKLDLDINSVYETIDDAFDNTLDEIEDRAEGFTDIIDSISDEISEIREDVDDLSEELVDHIDNPCCDACDAEPIMEKKSEKK